MRLSVIIVEPRTIVREGLEKLFTKSAIIESVYEVSNIKDLKGLLSFKLIDLVIVHQSFFEDMEPSAMPHSLIIADKLDKRILLVARDKGASGYILEDSVEGLLQPIVHLAEKKEEKRFLLDPTIAPDVLSSIDENVFLSTDVNILTPRQRQVFYLLHQGLDDPAIAEQLGVEEVTVRSHVADILRQLRVTRRQIQQLPLPTGRYIRKRQPPGNNRKRK